MLLKELELIRKLDHIASGGHLLRSGWKRRILKKGYIIIGGS